MTNKKESACAMLWVHSATALNGKVRPCCISGFSAHYAPSEAAADSSFHNMGSGNLRHPAIEKIRSMMSVGARPSECRVCYAKEDMGYRSKRQYENEKWKSDYTEVKLRTVDIRFNNICNLRCVTCNPNESSSWQSDARLIRGLAMNPKVLNNYVDAKQSTDNLLGYLMGQSSSIEEYYFAGGEPLAQPEHEQLLDYLVQTNRAESVSLVYNTNLTLLDVKFIDQWKRFKSVQLNVSIDGVGDRNEYLRYPSRWKILEEKIRFLDSTGPNISARITHTVSALNLIYIGELVNWKVRSRFKKIQNDFAPGDFDINIVHFPSYLCPQILPNNLKEIFQQAAADILGGSEVSEHFKTKLHHLCEFINAANDRIDLSIERSLMVQYLSAIDRIRGNSFQVAFPEVFREFNI